MAYSAKRYASIRSADGSTDVTTGLGRVKQLIAGDTEGAGHAGDALQLPQETFSRLFFGGEYHFAEAAPDATLHPPTGQMLSELIPGASDKDANAACAAAAKAWPGWSHAAPNKRMRAVLRLADLVREGVEVLADLESADCGRSWYDSRLLILGAVSEGELWAYQGQSLEDEIANHRLPPEEPEFPPIPDDEAIRKKLVMLTPSEQENYARKFGVVADPPKPEVSADPQRMKSGLQERHAARQRNLRTEQPKEISDSAKSALVANALARAREERKAQQPILERMRGAVASLESTGPVYITPDPAVPLCSALRDLLPALLVGNTALILAPGEAPLSVLAISYMALKAELPPGVVNVIAGRRCDEVVRKHPAIARLPSQLRRSPGVLIIFDDIGPVQAATAALKGMIAGGGMFHSCHQRLVLQRGQHDGFADAVLTHLRRMLSELPYLCEPIEEHNHGDRAWESGEPQCLQALPSREARDRARLLIDQQKRLGGEQLKEMVRFGFIDPNPPPKGIGGTGGYWVEPIVFVDPPPHSLLWTTPCRAPVLLVRFFDTDFEAVKLANEPIVFASAATVMTEDRPRAERVGQQVRAAAVSFVSGEEPFLSEWPVVTRGERLCSWAARGAWSTHYGVDGLRRWMETRELDLRYPTASDQGSASEGDESLGQDED